jgi:short-subunit dehydrogenase
MPKLESLMDVGAIVTGASSGIGRILAQELAINGARVALVARREAELTALAEEISAHPSVSRIPDVLPCDVSDRDEVERAAITATERLGSVDLLVNNAGYGHHRRFVDWTIEDMERMMRVNYFGSLYWTKAVLPQMISRRRGWLTFVSSIAGRIAPPEESAYAASKFAVTGLAESLTNEVLDDGIHVLTVYPGVIRTPFFDEEALARMPAVARRQMIAPEKLVKAILNALAAGRHELTFPRGLAAAYPARAIAPGFTRRQVKRRTIDSLSREGR